jgi:plasmid maintenance system killer protein
MIKTFRHKGLEAFFKTGNKAGIQPNHAGKLRIMLTALDNAKRPSTQSILFCRVLESNSVRPELVEW